MLKDNAFFQSAMQNNKMILVTHRYEPWIVEDGFMFGNQYNAFNAEGKKDRIHDAQLCCIFNDKRLKDFYVCSQGQGTYEECKSKIAEYRTHIKQCKNCDGSGTNCWHWRCVNTVSSDTSSIYDESTDREIVTKTTVYQYACNYNSQYQHDTECIYDIEEEPKLCTDAWKKDYFVQHPEGIPDQMPLRQFFVDHRDQFDLDSRRWSQEEPSATNGFRCVKLFGSYTLEADRWDDCFILKNSRNSFIFRYDMQSHHFIIGGRMDIGYNVTRVFTESKYDHNLGKSVSQPIACWDKFIKWWQSAIDEYINESYKKGE
jgi:hypothetical protein